MTSAGAQHDFPTRLLRSAIALIVIALSARAEALDPSKTLSQYVRRIWQVQQGLPEASIDALLQTHDGYLWLGTPTGLIKFDGVRFTTIDAIDGLPLTDIHITRLLEGHDGALWIGTRQSGLIRIQGGKARRYTRKNGLPSDSVECLVGDPAGNVWACTSGALAELSGDTIRVFTGSDGLSTPTVRAACSTRNGTVIVGDDSGRVFTRTGDRFTIAAPERTDASITQAMLCASDGTLWIGSSSGLIHHAGGRQLRMTTADGLADNSVLSLAQGRTGDVFAGTKNGFSRIRGRDVERFLPQDGLSQSTVFALYEDREGSLWVATKHGLNQFLDGITTSYTTSEGLPSNQAGPVLEDSRGTMWAGTLGGGLGRFDGHRFATLTMADGLASNTIYALAEGRDGDLWAGTASGLNRLRNGRVTGTWTTRQGLPGNSVRALYRDREGALWIASSGGLAVFRAGRISAVRSQGRRTAESILAIGGDRNGRLYLAPESDSPLLRDADAVHEDADGLLWIGTLGQGLRLVDNGRVFSFSETDGLFDDAIYGITEDDGGRLWMACSKGIFSVNRDDLRQFAAGLKRRIVSTPYSPLDALRTIECRPGVQPVAARTDGRLWFATTRGLLVIDPSHLSRSLQPPTAVVEDATVNGERLAAGAIGKLPPDRNNVEFSYTGVSFVVPNRITFSYLLEGFDKNWVNAGTRRQTFYANLPPGHFRFRVSACNPDNTCGEASEGTTFQIEPRYYQRAWFLPVCGVGLVLLFWTGYRLRIRRLRAKFDLILAERGRIARELHDTLIQGFAGITMSMQALASRLPSSGTRDTLEEIVADAGHSLRAARQSLSGLRSRPEEPAGLAPSVARIARHLTEPNDVRLKLTLEDQHADLPADVEYNLLRIAQEAMQNAVRHSGARTLDVTLESSRQRLRLSVNDDGSGFDEASSPPAGHYGLIGMRERAAQIGAIFELTSERGRGTTVSVLLEP